MLAGAFVVSLIFIILLIVNPCILKPIFKIESFLGYTMGLCCSFITALIITVCVVIAIILVTLNIEKSVPMGDDAMLESLGIGVLLIVFVVVTATYLAVFFVLMCYTKKVTAPEYAVNSIFMFISGYSFLSFIVIYIALAITALALENTGSSFLILFEFIIFFYILKLAGISLMFMLYHRNANRLLLFIAMGVYFGPLIFFLIGIFAKAIGLLEYPTFVFDIASIALGSFFYFKYAGELSNQGTVSPTDYNRA